MKQKDLYGWVMAASRREAVIRVMDRPKIPRDIRKEAMEFNDKLSRSGVSITLRDFVKKGIAVCVNEDYRVGRVYELTSLGKEIREEVLKKKAERKHLV